MAERHRLKELEKLGLGKIKLTKPIDKRTKEELEKLYGEYKKALAAGKKYIATCKKKINSS